MNPKAIFYRTPRAVFVVLALLASTLTVVLSTTQPAQAIGGKRAALLFPFSGKTWLAGDGPDAHHHFWNPWGMDLHAPVGTGVKASFATTDGSISLSVASVGATCAAPNSAGSNVTVNVYVDGTFAGEVIYGHLNNVAVSAGQSIANGTTLGTLNNWARRKFRLLCKAFANFAYFLRNVGTCN